MKITYSKTAELKPNPFNAIVKKLFFNDNIEIILLELEAHKLLSPVKIDVNAFFFILEGTPEITINNESHISKPEELIFCPVESTHCINNPFDLEAKILIIRQKV
jgi:quercetin dioxygenase-like cupin family protein